MKLYSQLKYWIGYQDYLNSIGMRSEVKADTLPMRLATVASVTASALVWLFSWQSLKPLVQL